MFPINRQRKRQNSNFGFTLLELIFVAAILVFIATLAIPQFRRSFDFLGLQNFVSDVASFGRYAQARAIIDGITTRLIFNIEEKTFAIESYVGVETGGEGAKEKWEQMKSKSIPDFVSIDLEDMEDGVKFYPDGTADKASINIGIPSGKNYSVSIESATGYVKVEELTEK